jgi:hypothetical protein
MIPYTLRFWLFLLIWACLLWKYRKNKIIALGTITLGFAALAFLLSETSGVSDWAIGIAVAIFLLLAIAVPMSPLFFLMKRMYRKSCPLKVVDSTQSLEQKD